MKPLISSVASLLGEAGTVDSEHVKVENETEVDGHDHDLSSSNSLHKYNCTPRPHHLTNIEMSSVGKQVKRILDHGRIEYLRKIGFNASIIRYCYQSYNLRFICLLI
jgi:hypothetical protein